MMFVEVECTSHRNKVLALLHEAAVEIWQLFFEMEPALKFNEEHLPFCMEQDSCDRQYFEMRMYVDYLELKRPGLFLKLEECLVYLFKFEAKNWCQI